jgi:hypothetical protein
MAMDLCEHGDLYDMAKYVHGRRLPLPAVRVWMAQVRHTLLSLYSHFGHSFLTDV